MRIPHDQSKKPNFARAIIYLLATSIFAISNPVSAAGASLPLDVVLVMDSSGSMKKTDPRELRKSAAKLLISLLGDQDRASVVSFSDQGYPVAYLTPVKGKQNETDLFAAADRISNKGVYTNLLGGVQAAMRVIQRNPLTHHKPIIVLMTDGKMDLGDSATNQANSDSLLNDIVPQLKRLNIELHTIAFTDRSDKAYLESLANATGGKFNLAHSDKQLYNVYTSIFEQNKQPDMLPFNGDKFTIDKTVDEITIVGSKKSETLALSLIAPDGNFITAENKPASMRWFTAQDFDLITIKNPKAGVWRLQSSNGKNKAYIHTDLEFQLKAEPQETSTGQDLLISAWLENNGKTVDTPSILSDLTVELRVSAPDGQTRVLAMQPRYKTDNRKALSGVYINRFTVPAGGSYQIEVIANGNAFSRARNSLVKVLAPAMLVTSATTPVEAVNPAIESMAKANAQTQDVQRAAKAEAELADISHVVHRDTTPGSERERPVDTKVQKTEVQKTEVHKTVHKPQVHKAIVEAVKAHSQEVNQETAHKDPDLFKTLIIFLVINGMFVATGAFAFFVYRWDRKIAPAPPQPKTSIPRTKKEKPLNSLYRHV